MKKIKSLLLNACAYTLLLLVAFFLFAAVGLGDAALLSFGSFVILLTIGAILSASGMIFSIPKLNYPVKVIIHFAVMLLAFLWTLSAMGHLAEKAPSAFVVIIFGFALIYAAVSVAAHFIKKLAFKIGTKLDKKLEASKKTEKKAEYKPLYK